MHLTGNVEDHITWFRRGVGDDQYDMNLCIGYLNRALDWIEREYKSIRGMTERCTWPSEQYKSHYDLPLCVTEQVLSVRYDGDRLEWMAHDDYLRMDESTRYRMGTPEKYTVHKGNLILWPIPDTAAATFTVASDYAWDDTAIELDSLSGLPEQGTLQLDEVDPTPEHIVRYSGLDDDNTQVLNVERNQEGSNYDTTTRNGPGALQTAWPVTYRNIDALVVGNLKRFVAPPAGNMAELETTVGGLTAGKHSFWITYYSSYFRSESHLVWVGEIDPSDGDGGVNLNRPPISTNKFVDQLRVYMSKANEVIPYWVDSSFADSWYNPILANSQIQIVAPSDTYLEDRPRMVPMELNIPRRFRSAVTDIALMLFYYDEEQYMHAESRAALAQKVLNDWSQEQDNESGYFVMG